MPPVVGAYIVGSAEDEVEYIVLLDPFIFWLAWYACAADPVICPLAFQLGNLYEPELAVTVFLGLKAALACVLFYYLFISTTTASVIE